MVSTMMGLNGVREMEIDVHCIVLRLALMHLFEYER